MENHDTHNIQLANDMNVHIAITIIYRCIDTVPEN